MSNVFYRVPHIGDVDWNKVKDQPIETEKGKCGSCGETIIYHPPALEMAARAAPDLVIVCNRCEDFVRKATEGEVASD